MKKKPLKISASSASRIQKCPGSAHLEAKLKDKYRVFLYKESAEFGTLCHSCGEEILLNGELSADTISKIEGHPRCEDILYIVQYYSVAVNRVLNQLGASIRSLLVEKKYRKVIEGIDCVAKCDALSEHTNGVLVADLKTGTYDYTDSAYEQMFFAALLWLAKQGRYMGEKQIKTVTIQPMYYHESYRVFYSFRPVMR